MANSTRPIRGITIIALVVGACIAAGILYTYSVRTGAPDDTPISGANLPEPSSDRQ